MDVYQRRRLVALSAIAGIFIIFVLLIRSCGGDDEATPITPVAGASGTTGASLLSQDDYVSQADAICLEANTALANVDESDLAQAAGEQEEIVTGQLQQLQTLSPPDDGNDQLDKFLAALEDLAIAYGDKATAAERGDDAAAAELDATIDQAQADVAKAAKKFGFEVCGDPSQVGDSDGGDSTSTDDTATTDTGAATAPPATEVVPETAAPETAAPAPETAPPTDTGAAAPPATDAGGTDSSSGGVSP